MGAASEQNVQNLRHIIPALTQRAEMQRQYAEPVIEVAAKRAALDLLLQVFIARRQNPHIDRNHPVISNAGDLLFLKYPQQPRLHGGGNFTDLVEKEGPAVGQLENAGFSLVARAGKSAFDIAEQLAFQQVFGQGGAVERHKGRRVPGRVIVDTLGKQLLSGTRFPGDQHCGIGGGKAHCPLFEAAHRFAAAHDIVEVFLGVKALLNRTCADLVLHLLDTVHPLEGRHRAHALSAQADRLRADHQPGFPGQHDLIGQLDPLFQSAFQLGHCDEFTEAAPAPALGRHPEELTREGVDIGQVALPVNRYNAVVDAVENRGNRFVAVLLLAGDAQQVAGFLRGLEGLLPVETGIDSLQTHLLRPAVDGAAADHQPDAVAAHLLENLIDPRLIVAEIRPNQLKIAQAVAKRLPEAVEAAHIPIPADQRKAVGQRVGLFDHTEKVDIGPLEIDHRDGHPLFQLGGRAAAGNQHLGPFGDDRGGCLEKVVEGAVKNPDFKLVFCKDAGEKFHIGLVGGKPYDFLQACLLSGGAKLHRPFRQKTAK